MKEVLEDQNDVILGCNKTKPQMESSFTSPSKIEIKIIKIVAQQQTKKAFPFF